ncbi:hypothetical protein BDZ45DRAFT_423397, partial [Acephala macrosclerotiorum]
APSADVSNIPTTLATSLSLALIELCRYTIACCGHKTMMDALIPFIETFAQTLDFQRAVRDAATDAEGIRDLDAVS